MSDRGVLRSFLLGSIFISFLLGQGGAFYGGPLEQTQLSVRLRSVWLDCSGGNDVDLAYTNSHSWVFLLSLLVLLTAGYRACMMQLLHIYLDPGSRIRLFTYPNLGFGYVMVMVMVLDVGSLLDLVSKSLLFLVMRPEFMVLVHESSSAII